MSRFSKNPDTLVKGDHYLLKVPGYCESGYTMALFRGHEDGTPVFMDETMGHTISETVIEGWTDPCKILTA